MCVWECMFAFVHLEKCEVERLLIATRSTDTGMVKTCKFPATRGILAGCFFTSKSVLFCETLSYHVYLLFLKGMLGRRLPLLLFSCWHVRKPKFTQSLTFSSWKYILKITHKIQPLCHSAQHPLFFPSLPVLGPFIHMKLMSHRNLANQRLCRNPYGTPD